MNRKKLAVFIVIIVIAAVCVGIYNIEKSPLNPDKPVTLTVWHYYNGAQQAAFDSLVEEFNNTDGKEKGIYVKGYGQGSVSDLEKAVMDSVEGKVGSDKMPDIFSTYADTAYEIEEKGKLANLSEYLSGEDISKFIETFIDEGRIGKDNTLRIFPVAKSTEIMMINKTDWDKFAQDTGVSLDDIVTLEDIVEISEKYYNWTDDKTPEIANDGKAFFGIDSVANYFNIGMKQLDNEIFKVSDGKVVLNTDKDSIKTLWKNYYIPMVKGYFGAYGSFRSDDVKTGDLVAYVGSTTSTMYFPDNVETDEGSYPIEYIVREVPLYGGAKYGVQQGAGMAVSKSDKLHEYASVEFLKWFTEKDNNIRFCCSTGYLPVLQKAIDSENLDKVIKDNNLEVDKKSYDCLTYTFQHLTVGGLYTNKSFKNSSKARWVLENNLSDKIKEDRKAIEDELAAGKSLEEACSSYITEDAFEQWYSGFCNALEGAIEGN